MRPRKSYSLPSSKSLRHVAIVLALGCAACASPGQFPNNVPNASRTLGGPGVRASLTADQMTLDEKLTLLQTILLARIPYDKQPKDIAIGVGYTPGVPRLGVPPLVESDASLGVANMGGFIRPKDGATALPSGLAMASTWSPELIEAGGQMIGGETRAKGFNVLLAGGANLVREPRNGRNFEYLSEDPLLTGMLAGAAVSGIQKNHIISTIKHYALNAQETGRSFLNVEIDEAAMRESDLLAFQIANEIGKPGAVMCSYNKVNGTHACENSFLLNRVLRRDWGFDGYVLSDWGGVHGIVLQEGLDQESGVREFGESWYGDALRKSLSSGETDAKLVDQSVERILNSIYRLELDKHPVSVGNPIDFDTNALVAQRIAEEGIVLLKNHGGFLPIPPDTKSILVIGAHADVGVPSGGGSSQVWPAGNAALSLEIPGDVVYHRRLYMPSSPLEELRKQFPEAEISYDDGTDHARAAAAARKAEVTVIFAEQFMAEGWDAIDLNLPGTQGDLIDTVAKASPRTAIVLETGGPVTMPWLDKVPAVLQAWYSGQNGGAAIARILSGTVNPSGRLPVTFPGTIEQLPNPTLPGSDAIVYRPGSDLYDLPKETTALNVNYPEGSDVGYRWYAKEGIEPLFAFGHGLSYSKFESGNLSIAGTTATATVRNTGKVKGAFVAQLYLTARPGDRKRRLVGFKKVELVPSESETVTMEIDRRLLADWNDGGWLLKGGTYRFALGDNALHMGSEIAVTYEGARWTDSQAAERKAERGAGYHE